MWENVAVNNPLNTPANNSSTNPAKADYSQELLEALDDGFQPAVVTVTGDDQPGVTAEFFRVLSSRDVQLIDVEQSVFRGSLSLAALIGVRNEEIDELQEELSLSLIHI